MHGGLEMKKLKHLIGIITGLAVTTGAYAGDLDTTLSLRAIKNVLKSAGYYKFNPDEVVQQIKEKNGTVTPRDLMITCFSLNNKLDTCQVFIRDVIIEHNKLSKNSPYAGDQDCLSKAQKIYTQAMHSMSPNSKYFDIVTRHNVAVDKINEVLLSTDNPAEYMQYCSDVADGPVLEALLFQKEKEISELWANDAVYGFSTSDMTEEDLINVAHSWIIRVVPYIEEYAGPVVCVYKGEDSSDRYVECHTDTIVTTYVFSKKKQ